MADDEEELFEVENIVDSRTYHGVVQYRVRWANFSPRHDTWEPEDNLFTCHDLIERYLAEKNSKNDSHKNNSSNQPSTSENNSSNSWSDSSNLFSNLTNEHPPTVTAEIKNKSSENGEKIDDEQSEQEDEEKIIDDDNSPSKTSPKKGVRRKRQRRWEWAELKDDFWKKLEHGQVDLSQGMYERVKRKRQSTPKENNIAETTPTKRRGRPKSKAVVEEDDDEEENENEEENEVEDENNSDIHENLPQSSNKIIGSKTATKKSNKQHQQRAEVDEIIETLVDKKSSEKSKPSSSDVGSSSLAAEKFINSVVNDIRNDKKETKIQNGASNSGAKTSSLKRKRESSPSFYENLGKLVDDVIDKQQKSKTPNEDAPKNSEKRELVNGKCGKNADKNKEDKIEKSSESDELPKQNGGLVEEDENFKLNSVEKIEDQIEETVSIPKFIELVQEKEDVQPSTSSAADDVTKKLSVETPKITKPTGRWLPLAPKLVTKVQEINNESSQIIFPPHKPKSPVKLAKKSSDLLPMPVDEDLNVSDFFKSDMHHWQEDERQTARFLTNDDFYDACRDGIFEGVRSALTASKNFKCPYDLESLDVAGNTLLMSAAVQKCDLWHSGDDIIEVLVQHGANLNASNREGDTALMLAITREHLCKVTKLLSLGAAVNLPNRCGETPLMVACVKGFAPVVQRLLDYGADFNASTTTGRSVANMASHSKSVTKVLQSHESKVKQSFEHELTNVLEPDKIKIKHTLFPMHCYALNESRTFRIMFNYTPFVLPRKHFVVLVIGVGKFAQNLSVRFWGVSPVVSIVLNDVDQQAIQEDGRFIFTLCPLKAGANELLIKCAENSKTSQCKLLTTAFVVQAA